ncbi:hypothetical protein niasHT_039958 [Heterodera trifolii]|uniref:Uncharacterized protein n=1 Tax=Heterodera trifolii TaxID=157864 RepID=A0ABD2I7U4_9BILA
MFLIIILLHLFIIVSEAASDLTEHEQATKIHGNTTDAKRTDDAILPNSVPIILPSLIFDQQQHSAPNRSIHRRFTTSTTSFTTYPAQPPSYPIEPVGQAMPSLSYPIGPPPQPPVPPSYPTVPQAPFAGTTSPTACECCCCSAYRSCPCRPSCPPCCGGTHTTSTTVPPTKPTEETTTTTTTTHKTPKTTTPSSTPVTNPPLQTYHPCCLSLIINCPNNNCNCPPSSCFPYTHGGGCSAAKEPCPIPPYLAGTGGYPVGMPKFPAIFPPMPNYPGIPMPNYYPTMPRNPGYIYPPVGATNYPIIPPSPYAVSPLPNYPVGLLNSRGSAFAKAVDKTIVQTPTSAEEDFRAKFRRDRLSAADIGGPKKVKSGGVSQKTAFFFSTFISFGALLLIV